MLDDTVPSEPAQDAWARYWSTHVTRLGREPESIDPRAAVSARARDACRTVLAGRPGRARDRNL